MPPLLSRPCYAMNMDQTITRTITGIFILLLGVGALLDGLGILNFWEYFGTWWPLILVAGGILIFLNDFRQYITGIALVLVGTVLTLNNLNIVEVDIWSLIWPVIIISVGLSILINY